jgi:hypothetical protein
MMNNNHCTKWPRIPWSRYMALHHTIFVGTFTCIMYYHTQFIAFGSNCSSLISNKHCMQQSINYLTISCILVEELSPYNILRSCPTALAAKQTCSHLKSFLDHYFNISENTTLKHLKVKWSLLVLYWYPVTHNSSTDYKLFLCKQITNMIPFSFRKLPYFLQTYKLSTFTSSYKCCCLLCTQLFVYIFPTFSFI